MNSSNDNLHIEHISFTATDNVVLYGLRYIAGEHSKKIAIYLHGAGSSSILRNPQLNIQLAAQLTRKGVDLLMFENRGASYIKKLHIANNAGNSSTRLGGMAYETIEECTLDIYGALEWAHSAGYRTFYLIGHSTGANKLCYFLSDNTKQSAIKKVYLLAGGDDITLQRKRFKDNGINCENILEAVNASHEDELVPAKSFPGEHPISYKSLRELVTPYSDYDIFPFVAYQETPADGRLFRQFKSIQVPTVVIYGSLDFGTVIAPSAAIELLTSLNTRATGYLIDGANHNFNGFEETLAEVIAKEL